MQRVPSFSSHTWPQQPAILRHFSWDENWNPIAVCVGSTMECLSFLRANCWTRHCSKHTLVCTSYESSPFLQLQSYVFLALHFLLIILCFRNTVELNKMKKFHHTVKLLSQTFEQRPTCLTFTCSYAHESSMILSRSVLCALMHRCS